jgi:hypothetical protein
MPMMSKLMMACIASSIVKPPLPGTYAP